MREITLYRGQIALVDDEDFEAVSRYRWRLHRDGYAQTGNNPNIYMHRLILQPPSGYVSDHINGDRLDNRRANLRSCTGTENTQNRFRAPHKQGYKGVFLHQTGRYQAMIKANNTRVFLGTFADPEIAARAYDASARELHGEFARLNFPRPGEQPA